MTGYSADFITWAPYRYPLRWAESLDEVPSWDISRGIHPRIYFSKNEWEEQYADLLLNPSKHQERQSFIREKWSWQYSRQVPTIFPRLVCDVPVIITRYDRSNWKRPKQNVSEAIASLTKFFDRPAKLKHEILTLASNFTVQNQIMDFLYFRDIWGYDARTKKHDPELGVVQTYKYTDTIPSWINIAKVYRFLLTLATIIDEECNRPRKNRRPIAEVLSEAEPPTHLNFELPQLEWPPILSLFMQGRRKGPHQFEADRQSEIAPTCAEELRDNIHDWFLELFESRAQIILCKNRLYITNGCQTWGLYELAAAFRPRHSSGVFEVRLCKHCRSPFYPRRKNQETCDPPGKTTCKRMANYRKQMPKP